jgi:CcmD family protein
MNRELYSLETFYEFLDKHDLFIVLLIVLVIWAVIYLYLFRLDKKIRKIEQAHSDTKK